MGGSGVPLYTTFPASQDADGFDNIYIPTGTRCTDCQTPVSTYGAVLAGRSKAASLGFGVSQASKDCVNNTAAEIDEFGPGAGVEFVYKNDNLAFGFPNGIAPEVTAMKEAGVDYITTCIDSSSALTLEQELQRQGLGDSVTVVLPQGYGDSKFISGNADLLEGDLLSVPYRPVEADAGDSILPTMTEWLNKSGAEINDYAIQGWMSADLAVTGLLAAGPQFDRAKVVSSTNQITDFTADGLLAPPVDWTTAHNAPDPSGPSTTCFAFLSVHDGALQLEGDASKPFNCWDLPLTEWTEPTPVG